MPVCSPKQYAVTRRGPRIAPGCNAASSAVKDIRKTPVLNYGVNCWYEWSIPAAATGGEEGGDFNNRVRS